MKRFLDSLPRESNGIARRHRRLRQDRRPARPGHPAHRGRLVAVCDRERLMAGQLAERFGIPESTPTSRDMLDAGTPTWCT